MQLLSKNAENKVRSILKLSPLDKIENQLSHEGSYGIQFSIDEMKFWIYQNPDLPEGPFYLTNLTTSENYKL